MDDAADVRLVDAHAEGDGRNDARDLAREELVMRLAPRRIGQTRVVRSDGGVRREALQGLGRGLDLAARRAVDDRRAAGTQGLGDGLQRAHEARVAAAPAAEPQVGTIEALGCDVEARPQAEVVLDVRADPVGGRRREGDQGHVFGDAVAEAGERPVRRAEVVAPLGDAVRLVDRNEGQADGDEGVGEALVDRLLGGRVHEPERAAARAVLDAPVGLRRPQEARDVAARRHVERPDLIHHEAHERRDHEDHAVTAHERRQLVNERLAGARRPVNCGVRAAQDRVHCSLLAIAERVVTPDLAQRPGHRGAVIGF